jgi:hypothetical protein
MLVWYNERLWLAKVLNVKATLPEVKLERGELKVSATRLMQRKEYLTGCCNLRCVIHPSCIESKEMQS